MADDGSAAPLPADRPSEAEGHALDRGDETTLSLSIARRYYFQEQSKVTIAKALGLSRFQIARLLQDARRNGLVRIEIGSPGRIDRELSAALQQTLGISRAVVVQTPPGSSPALEFVGRAMADTLSEEVQEGDMLGLTWSRAAVVLAENLKKLCPCTVVQLAGALYPPDRVPGSVEVVRMVAAVSGGTAHPIYAPLVVSNADTARGLRCQPEIAAAMTRFDQMDIAVLSVGAWRASGSAVYDLLSPTERQDLTESGVCGEISGRLFDSTGHLVASDLDHRVIGIDADQLRAVPKLITSSYGAYRAEATRAAVRAGFVHTLVTDDELARALLR